MNGMISRSLMGVFCSACFSVMNAQDRPNIVVFIVDDMGLMDTSVPFVTDHHGNAVKQPLNEWYRTPNMERLAKQGIRFSTFYAQSVSSPSRASIMTGRMQPGIVLQIGFSRRITTVLLMDRWIGIGKD